MKLPIAQESYQPSAGTLRRAATRAELTLARTAGTETVLDGAVAIVNTSRPGVHMVNFAGDVSVPQGSTAEAVLDEVLAHFADAGATCWTLYTVDGTTSDDLTNAAEARGFEPQQTILMKVRQRRAVSGLNDQLQIIPARAAYGELRELYRADAAELMDDTTIREHLVESSVDHYDEPRLEGFIGRLEGKAAGIVAVVTLGQIGYISDVFTLPQVRRLHVARTLLSYLLDHCARAQFEQVLLEVEPENEPAIALYKSMGFAEIARMTSYQLASEAAADAIT